MSSITASDYSPMLVLDPYATKRMVEERRERGIDKHDEIWEGMYVMSPGPSNEHQRLVGELFDILKQVVKPFGGRAFPGANVTDRERDWENNYRIPDIAIVLPECKAQDIGQAWFGGPDFLVEVRSPYDKTMEKLGFYASVGVRELLVVDRDSKELELIALKDGVLQSQGSSTVEQPATLTSSVLPLGFQIQAAEPPQIRVRELRGEQREWVV